MSSQPIRCLFMRYVEPERASRLWWAWLTIIAMGLLLAAAAMSGGCGIFKPPSTEQTQEAPMTFHEQVGALSQQFSQESGLQSADIAKYLATVGLLVLVAFCIVLFIPSPKGIWGRSVVAGAVVASLLILFLLWR